MSSDKKNVGTADFMHLTLCQAAGPLRFELTQPSCQLPRKSQSEALQKCFMDFPIGNQPTMGRKWVRAALQLNWCTCVAAAVLSELDGSLTLKEKKKTLFCFGFTVKWLDPAQLINTQSDNDTFRENISFLCHSAALNHFCREIQKQ